MYIMPIGHLDRAFLMGGKPDRFRRSPLHDRSPHADGFEPYRSFFHRAGMMSTLSDGVAARPDLAPFHERILSHRGTDGRVYDSISQTELEDDATRLAHLVVRANAFSDATSETMRLRAPSDPHEPNLVHHVEHLLCGVLHAWQLQVTLVLAECDRQVLVELLDCVVKNLIALPFHLPDFRKVKACDSRSSGAIANLEPGDLNDTNAMWVDPVFLTYRQRLRRFSESRAVNVGTLLNSALKEAREASSRIREAPSDITLTSTWVRTIDTVDLPSVEVDPFGWSNRKPSKPKMHTIVLSSPRSLC